MMSRWCLVLLLSAALLMGACATSAKKQDRSWQAGDSVICPHCGRQFPIPEKLGQ